MRDAYISQSIKESQPSKQLLLPVNLPSVLIFTHSQAHSHHLHPKTSITRLTHSRPHDRSFFAGIPPFNSPDRSKLPVLPTPFRINAKALLRRLNSQTRIRGLKFLQSILVSHKEGSANKNRTKNTLPTKLVYSTARILSRPQIACFTSLLPSLVNPRFAQTILPRTDNTEFRSLPI